MVELINPPDPQALLPPILACLPTAFASSRPPPALLPLLSPILKQRLQLAGDSRDNWIKLFCWDKDKAETVKDNVESSTFEPHPVSGEIEVGETRSSYKRLDEDTLQCQMQLEEWQFTPIFLWCSGGEDGNGWRLAEMLPEPNGHDDWVGSIAQANEVAKERIVAEALREADAAESRERLQAPVDAEDDYWAQYDKAPSETPMRKPSILPSQALSSEDEYFAQYGEVQPAMDNHDPDEEMANGTETTLNGHNLHPTEHEPPPYQDLRDDERDTRDEKDVQVQHPVPDSPGSRGGSDAVARLETAAETFNSSEVGIRQHIGTTIKSMYRLAKSGGMDREEFERIVQRELETLSIIDKDD